MVKSDALSNPPTMIEGVDAVSQTDSIDLKTRVEVLEKNVETLLRQLNVVSEQLNLPQRQLLQAPAPR